MTIKDVAKLCGVSVSTVSRVLNDRPDVSEQVREQVLRTVREINFVPNNSARRLVMTNSDSVGLVVRGVSNPFYSDIIKAIGRKAEEAGMTLVMQQIHTDEDEIETGAIMEREKRLRGLIFLGGRSDYMEEKVRLITVPFVCCSYTNSFGSLEPGSYSSVSIEDELAARRAVNELTSLGHRRIACLVAHTHDRSISELRYRGYVKALEDNGIEPDESLVVSAGSFDMADAYRATVQLVKSGADFTAMFIIADAMAIAAIKALYDCGRSVPRDCSVIAIDGLQFSEYTHPTLTTLCQPTTRMGEESVKLLRDVLEGRSGHRHVVLEPVLRHGASVAPAP